jgi:hypothetical protein
LSDKRRCPSLARLVSGGVDDVDGMASSTGNATFGELPGSNRKIRFLTAGRGWVATNVNLHINNTVFFRTWQLRFLSGGFTLFKVLYSKIEVNCFIKK